MGRNTWLEIINFLKSNHHKKSYIAEIKMLR